MTAEEEKKKTWENVLLFLAYEWFGAEFVKDLMGYKFNPTTDSLQEGDKRVYVTLLEYEKILWNFVDAVFAHLQKHRNTMPAGELREKRKIGHGLYLQFWATLQINHPEIMDTTNPGIRDGYVIVDRASIPGNPFTEILKGGFPG